MFPELFKIPYTNFSFNTYGFLLAVAFVSGLVLMARLAARDSLDKQKVYDLGLWVLAASLIGSKALMVITEWDSTYRDSPRQIFTLDFFRSGGVYYGGFIGAVIASVIVMRFYKLPWWRTADAFAPGIILGQAIGRLGCFSAGCCWGKPTTGWYGVHFSEKGHEITNVPTMVSHLTDQIQQNVWAERLGGALEPIKLHPTQLYEAGAALLILVVLLLIHRRRRFEGQVILAYAMLYSVARFIIEYWRDDPRGEIFGLSTSQFIALILFVGALATFIYRLRKPSAALQAQPAS
ncbi:MAG TPA: prolipoprotein diacylglyceryl transferase [Blastocatellia bacterium]|jgi:phosphatidylglycerol:prolipoprotein diacylglycerol transferase|nr:prolipoprotein diacylglyceryl transferase [Blastocatellia bacterium]